MGQNPLKSCLNLIILSIFDPNFELKIFDPKSLNLVQLICNINSVVAILNVQLQYQFYTNCNIEKASNLRQNTLKSHLKALILSFFDLKSRVDIFLLIDELK